MTTPNQKRIDDRLSKQIIAEMLAMPKEELKTLANRRSMKINLDQLQELAEKATPGPWHIFPEDSYREHCHIILRTKSNFSVFTADHAKYEDSSFVASMNPTTALALIRVVRAAQAFIKEYQELRDERMVSTTTEANLEKALEAVE